MAVDLTSTSVEVETDKPDLEVQPGVHGLQVDDTCARFHVDTDELGGVVRNLSDLGIRTLTTQPRPRQPGSSNRGRGPERFDGGPHRVGRREHQWNDSTR